MLLAELEVWHSRPYAPTRRVALGHLLLPVDPSPGFGGLLLAGVVAAHVDLIDAELVPDLHRLVGEVSRGERIVQPRLRHRYQVDRHGLSRSRHRLVGHGEEIAFELESAGTPMQQVLGAVYATERLAPAPRHGVATLLHKAMRWHGPVGQSLLSFLTGADGSRATSLLAMADPRAWAMDVLQFEPGTTKPAKKDVMARFRLRLREVHPDHGGDSGEAAKMIAELGEARRILLES
jgi:hypothetical protein